MTASPPYPRPPSPQASLPKEAADGIPDDICAATPALAAATLGPNLLGARDDAHAVALWLQARAQNAHTLRAYRRCAEHLLQWCLHEQGIGLAAMQSADCMRYRQWLVTLGRLSPDEWRTAGWRVDAQHWLASHKAIRPDSPNWRPFDGPLSVGTVAQELRVVKALFAFLLETGYLTHQAWSPLDPTAQPTQAAEAAEAAQPAKPAKAPKPPQLADSDGQARQPFAERSLDIAQWAWLIDGITPVSDDREARLAVVLWLGYACGLRAAEMLSLTLGSLQPHPGGWHLQVLGRSGKRRSVPLPTAARDAVLAYLAKVGIGQPDILQAAGDMRDGDSISSDSLGHSPLLRAQRGRRSPGRQAPSSPLRYSTLYTCLKAYLARRADALDAHDALAAAKLRLASTHWLRHTCASLALRSGVTMAAVQQVLGHASMQSTAQYLPALHDPLQTAMASFTALSQSRP